MSASPTPPSDAPFKSRSGLRRILNATSYSADGLQAAWRSEHAFRQEIWLAGPLVLFACLVDVNAVGRALMIASVLLVLVIELLNSAIEAIVDRVSPELHTLSKRAKDMGSAAVFLGIVNVIAVWVIVLGA